LLADIAHIAGLVVAGIHCDPVPYSDFVTTTTHKTLRGPRGGMIMCREEYAKDIDKTVFPGIQEDLYAYYCSKSSSLQRSYEQGFHRLPEADSEKCKKDISELTMRGNDLYPAELIIT